MQKRKAGLPHTPAPTKSGAAVQKRKTGINLTPASTGSVVALQKRKTGLPLTPAPTGSVAPVQKRKADVPVTPALKKNLTKKNAPTLAPPSQVLQNEDHDSAYNLSQKKKGRNISHNSFLGYRSPMSKYQYQQENIGGNLSRSLSPEERRGNDRHDRSLSPLPEDLLENDGQDFSLSPLPDDILENDEHYLSGSQSAEDCLENDDGINFSRSPTPGDSQKNRGRKHSRNNPPRHHTRGHSPSRSPSFEGVPGRREFSVPDSNVLPDR